MMNNYPHDCGNAGLVQKFIGTAYQTVKFVADNMHYIKTIYDMLTQYNMLACVESVEQLKNIDAKQVRFARIYELDGLEKRYVDYAFIDNDESGIKPNGIQYTGSWIKVGTSSAGTGGDGSRDIAWVYNNGSAQGGEETIIVPEQTAAVTCIYVNGNYQYPRLGFEYDELSQTIRLAQPLEEGDTVIAMLSGLPADPETPNVDNFKYFNWVYNNGKANGGEQTFRPPYNFKTVVAVFINGLRKEPQYHFTWNSEGLVQLREPVKENDFVVIQIGGDIHSLLLPNVMSGYTFKGGATLRTINDHIYDSVSKKWYQWIGAYPKRINENTVAADQINTDGGIWDTNNPLGLWVSLDKSPDLTEVNNKINKLTKDTEMLTSLVNTVDLADFSEFAVGDDWTIAIQKALDTGKNVKGSGTYKVSSKLTSKGQKLIGDWKINPTHLTHLNDVKCNVDFDSKDVIRMIYMAVEYDLCALLIIKSLGFNMISHYTNFIGHELGKNGSIDKLLNNATTSGLKVIIDVDQGMEKNNLTMEQLIAKCDSFECVFGYSVYDEPGTRNISVEDQDARLNKLRGLTGKCLTSVDLIVKSNPPFYNRISKNYDLIFVDSYAQRYSSGTADDHYNWDMEKSRLDVGGIKAISNCDNLIHVGGLFLDKSEGGQYTKNVEQGIRHVKDFCTKNGGNYGIFIWDMAWDAVSNDCVMNSVEYQKACLYLSNQAVGNSHKTDYYIFGSAPNYADFGVASLLNKLIVADPNNITPTGWSDSYPCAVWQSDKKYSGIAFKGTSSKFVTTIKCNKYVSTYLDAISLNGALPDNVKLQLIGNIGGSQRAISPEISIKNNPTFILSSKWDGKSEYESLDLLVTGNLEDSGSYNLILRGLIVCTNW